MKNVGTGKYEEICTKFSMQRSEGSQGVQVEGLGLVRPAYVLIITEASTFLHITPK